MRAGEPLGRRIAWQTVDSLCTLLVSHDLIKVVACRIETKQFRSAVVLEAAVEDGVFHRFVRPEERQRHTGFLTAWSGTLPANLGASSRRIRSEQATHYG